MDENLLNTGKNSRRTDLDVNSKPNRAQDRMYKIVSTDYPGLAKNARGVSYESPLESPSQ